MKKIHLLFLVIPLCIFSTSCSNKVIDNQSSEADKIAVDAKIINDYIASNKANGNFSVRGYLSDKPDEVESRPADAYVKEDYIVGFNFYDYERDPSNWRAVDKECRKYIASLEYTAYTYRQRHGASAAMLDLYLLRVNDNIRTKNNDSEELKRAIAYHTENLIALKTYESGILAKSLKQLKGFWSDEKIEEIKKFGLAQSEKFSERRKSLRFFDEDLLDEIEFGGKKALKKF